MWKGLISSPDDPRNSRGKRSASQRPPKPSQHLQVKIRSKGKKKKKKSHCQCQPGGEFPTRNISLAIFPPTCERHWQIPRRFSQACALQRCSLPALLRCPRYDPRLENELQSLSRLSKGTTGYSRLPLCSSHRSGGEGVQYIFHAVFLTSITAFQGPRMETLAPALRILFPPVGDPNIFL